MSAAVKKSVRILANIRLEEGIYDMLLEASKIETAKRTVHIPLLQREGRLLQGRSAYVKQIRKKEESACIPGGRKGTKEFSELRAGDEIECIGPLGNGFALEGPGP